MTNKIKKSSYICMMILAITCWMNSYALAALRSVPSGYATIQAAINAAVDGDTIEVSPGEYKESLNFTSKNYTSAVTLSGLDRQNTIINPSGTSKRGLFIAVSKNITVTNLTIKNGLADGTGPNDQWGGGIFVDGSTGINITNCNITNNSSAHGGGVTIRNSSVNLLNNLIKDNIAQSQNTCQVSGGGIFVYSPSQSNNQVVVSGNQILNNKSQVPGSPPASCYALGAGMFHQLETGNTPHSASIVNNIFSGNQTIGAEIPSYGGGLYIYTSSSSQVQVRNNTFSNNIGLDGGGICVLESNAAILNNRFYNNTARYGGGVYGWHMYSQIEGNVFYKNIARDTVVGGTLWDSGGGAILFDESVGDSSHRFINNLLAENSSDSWGGGIDLYSSTYELSGNKIAKNAGSWGGGLIINTVSDAISNPSIINNIIVANKANDWGGGVGIGAADQRGMIKNNLIANNQAVNNAGGILVYGGAYPDIINNTISGNTTGGIRIDGSIGINVFNNIIANHTGSYGISAAGGASFTPAYNDVWNNATNYQGVSAGTGSISSDPKFVDASYYYLQASSPCVNTGNPNSSYFDRDGSRNDMGLYGGPNASLTGLPYYMFPENFPMAIRASNDTLWTSSFNSSGTFNNNWTSISGVTPSAPAIAWYPVSNQYTWLMVVRASNGSLWTATFNSFGIFNNNWTSIPGAADNTPALAWNPVAKKLQMVIRAADSSLWTSSFNSSGTFNNDWASIPGRADSVPGLAWNPAANNLQLVIRAYDSSIWTSSFNSSGTFNNDWASIPGATVDTPALAWNPGALKLQLVVYASDDSIWTSSFNSSGTFNNDWASIPGAAANTPALAWNAAAAQLQLVIRAFDDSLWTSSFNSSGIFNNDWASISGASGTSPAFAGTQ
jgi:parallel beta-helix repeat protein